MTVNDSSNTHDVSQASEASVQGNEQEVQRLEFQAHTQQVLHLMVHSLYTNKEVFLRELITNASDAIDKVRFLALTNHELSERLSSPVITLEIDKLNKTVSVEDNGIGMTRQEAISNLGTIARSGTIEFLEKIKQAKNEQSAHLIGQFGVGFYSSFIVASRVDVETLSALDPKAEPVLWRSDGQGTFTVSKAKRDKPGTKVTVHLKGSEHDDLLESWRIEGLVKKYTDFVSYPIRLGDATLNQTTALWARPRSEITQEQYDSFYTHLQGSMDDDKPLGRIHFSADAPLQYHVLLYIPSHAPADLMLQHHRSAIRLYAKRMLVIDSCDKLAPPYMQFLCGVVDSEDLSLNVSREMLQDNRKLDIIRKAIETQVLKVLQTMATEDEAKYDTFWKEFGRLFRIGASTDLANQQTIVKLLRYPSTATDDEETTCLDKYVARMKEGQKSIYYLTGSNLKALRTSPHLEVFKKKGVEVLLMHEAVDEWVVGALSSYDGKPLQSVSHGEVDLSTVADVRTDAGDSSDASDARDGAESKQDISDNELQACVEHVQKVLGNKVKQVRLSSRLTDSPSVLVAEEGDVSMHAERVMRMLDRDIESPKRILEVNPRHPIVKNLAHMIAAHSDSQDVTVFAELLLDQALLAEGVVPDPSTLVARIQQVMTKASAMSSGSGSSEALGSSGSSAPRA